MSSLTDYQEFAKQLREHGVLDLMHLSNLYEATSKLSLPHYSDFRIGLSFVMIDIITSLHASANPDDIYNITNLPAATNAEVHQVVIDTLTVLVSRNEYAEIDCYSNDLRDLIT